MSGAGTEATRRWRERHPEKAKAKDRRNAARRYRVEAAFIAAHQDRYDELMAESLGDDATWDARRRAAVKVMRGEWPDDWRHHLRVAREADDG